MRRLMTATVLAALGPLLAALLLVVGGTADAWAGPATDQLREGVERVVKILDDPALKANGKARERRAAIRTVANEFFDFQEIAKRALGRHWQNLTAAEREEFVWLFADLLERTYIAKIDRYSGEKVVFGREKLDSGFATISTKVPLKQGEEAAVDYQLYQRGDRWLVYDVVIEGISLVANYRVQFNKIIQTSSYQALAAQLKAKHKEFTEEEARLEARAKS